MKSRQCGLFCNLRTRWPSSPSFHGVTGAKGRTSICCLRHIVPSPQGRGLGTGTGIGAQGRKQGSDSGACKCTSTSFGVVVLQESRYGPGKYTTASSAAGGAITQSLILRGDIMSRDASKLERGRTCQKKEGARLRGGCKETSTFKQRVISGCAQRQQRNEWRRAPAQRFHWLGFLPQALRIVGYDMRWKVSGYLERYLHGFL
ncbi:hypothetical protein LZ30DRAFT_743061, partial [Colletotrichum cereale]